MSLLLLIWWGLVCSFLKRQHIQMIQNSKGIQNSGECTVRCHRLTLLAAKFLSQEECILLENIFAYISN